MSFLLSYINVFFGHIKVVDCGDPGPILVQIKILTKLFYLANNGLGGGITKVKFDEFLKETFVKRERGRSALLKRKIILTK